MPDKLENSCHVGKVVQPLQSIKLFEIAVSTVMDMLSKAKAKLDFGFVFKRLYQIILDILSNWEIGRFAM